MQFSFSLVLWMVLTGCTPAENSSRQAKIIESELVTPISSPEIDVAAIELLDLEGNPISWEGLQGKKVVLNFWATWCKPCIIEMPSMHEAFEQLGEDYVFLAASYEELEKIKKFAEKRDFAFQFVHTKTPIESLNIYSLPTTLLINSRGELEETIIGSREWNQEESINQLKAIP